LQNFRGAASRTPYYIFDLLSCEGRDLTHLPLVERRALLKSLDVDNLAWKLPSLRRLGCVPASFELDPTQNNSSGEIKMKLINSRFAASACFLTMLAAPASVLAQLPKPVPSSVRVSEPSTLAMTLVGLGIGMVGVVTYLRRKRSGSAA
jgi:hypothetical protein